VEQRSEEIRGVATEEAYSKSKEDADRLMGAHVDRAELEWMTSTTARSVRLGPGSLYLRPVDAYGGVNRLVACAVDGGGGTYHLLAALVLGSVEDGRNAWWTEEEEKRDRNGSHLAVANLM
jgi:hypothetical protein